MRVERRRTETVLVMDGQDVGVLELIEDRLAALMGYTPEEIEAWDRNADQSMVKALEALSRSADRILSDLVFDYLESLNISDEELLRRHHQVMKRFGLDERMHRAYRVLQNRHRDRMYAYSSNRYA